MPNIAFICSGQGSQRLGMGADLIAKSARAKEIFEMASEAANFDVATLCKDGPQEKLNDTRYTQPALVAVSLAACAMLQEAGVLPQAVAGFSLGEYAAHAIAGSLSEKDALRLVSTRGHLMADAAVQRPGGMLALLKCSEEQAEKLCERCADGQVMEPANLNCPGQVVVSGEEAAIKRAENEWAATGGRCVRIATSGAFHCSLMEGAAKRLEAELADVVFGNPRIPLYCNVDAKPLKEGCATEMLVRQMTSPVRWEETVRNMAAAGVDVFVELGPGGVLSGLVKRTCREAARYSVGTYDELQKAASALAA